MLYSKLKTYCDGLEKEFSLIAEEQKKLLQPLVAYIQKKLNSDSYRNQQPIKIIVICTHNSRRSHFGQVWLQVAADYYGLSNLTSYSGGTEGTAFNPRAVKALQTAGLQITTSTPNAVNPVYTVKYNSEKAGFAVFSKEYNHIENPQRDFAAVMVCTSADEACPIVLGADGRFPIPFEDPKLFDETDLETAKYAERCRDIGRAMFWVVKNGMVIYS